MVEKHPAKCNLCGGEVILVTNDKIYGRRYGNGWAYLCTQCRAHVGVHSGKSKNALGILANREMMELRQKCHALFDRRWRSGRERTRQYRLLAEQLGIPTCDCHFGHMDLATLKKAYAILRGKTVSRPADTQYCDCNWNTQDAAEALNPQVDDEDYWGYLMNIPKKEVRHTQYKFQEEVREALKH